MATYTGATGSSGGFVVLTPVALGGPTLHVD